MRILAKDGIVAGFRANAAFRQLRDEDFSLFLTQSVVTISQSRQQLLVSSHHQGFAFRALIVHGHVLAGFGSFHEGLAGFLQGVTLRLAIAGDQKVPE